MRNKNRLLATHAVQAETIGNLNIPAELDYSVKIKNVIYRVKQCLYKLFHFGKIHNSPAFPIGKFFDMVGSLVRVQSRLPISSIKSSTSLKVFFSPSKYCKLVAIESSKNNCDLTPIVYSNSCNKRDTSCIRFKGSCSLSSFSLGSAVMGKASAYRLATQPHWSKR